VPTQVETYLRFSQIEGNIEAELVRFVIVTNLILFPHIVIYQCTFFFTPEQIESSTLLSE